MDNILHDMKESLIRYSEVISQVIRAAVSVVDDQQIRLVYAGTWKYRIGVSMAEKGSIVRMAIDTGKTQVMLEPQSHPGCQVCPHQAECRESVEMWAPIMVEGRCLGIIGFIGETKRQQQMVAKDKDQYISFLEQIAELISFEAILRLKSQNDAVVIELLESVVESIDSGVLVLDKEGNVLRLNKMARYILRDPFPNIEASILRIEETGYTIDYLTEYSLVEGSHKHAVAGSLYLVHAGPFHQVLIFNDAELMRSQAARSSAFKRIIGTSQAIQDVRKQIQNAAASPSSVLLYAEDGLDRELYAQAIHDESSRRDKPFVIVDCADLPEQDPEQFLFGYAAVSNIPGKRGKPGQIENASGGTLFLDNVEALPLPMQRRFLPLLEKKEIIRVGSRRPRKINARVIASTGADLVKACEEGKFSRDFLYLLNVLPISIPPLRERGEDIRPLAIRFIQFFARELDKPVSEIQEVFWRSVESYDWPGNERELRSAMEYAVNMMDYPSIISSQHLPKRFQTPSVLAAVQPIEFNLEKVERSVIQCALQLQKEKGLTNEQIAHMLGISIATLYRKLKKLNVK